MILLRLCRNILLRLTVALVIISTLAAAPAFCQETEDSQVFISGFNAYQQKDYTGSIEKMNEVLQKYPDTPLRDMALFWLARSYYKAGNQQEAARYLSQFSKEYPDNPLKNTVESELLALTGRYEKGEVLSTGPAAQPGQLAIKKAEAEKALIATAKAEEEKQAAAAAETARITSLKQAAVKSAAEKKEQERLADAKAEQQRIALEAAAREKAEQQRIAEIKSTQERKAAEQLEQHRIAADRAEQAKLASANAEQERLDTALRAEAAAEAAKIAAQNADSERIAKAQAEQTRLKLAEAELIRSNDLKAENERKLAAEKAKAEQTRLVEERAAATKTAYREKAIEQYKTIINNFPTSKAAVTAVAKLRELGVAAALPPQAVVTALPENAQVLRFEVAQFAGFDFNLQDRPDSFAVGTPVMVPFEISNRGNGNDSFYLESGFPADFKAHFAAAGAPATAISQTPELAPDEIFKGVVSIIIPNSSIDGLRIAYPVKAASRLLAEASQSREIRFIASAPLLRAVVRTDKTRLLPGDKAIYRVAILNVGSAAAKDVTFRFNFPPQLEPVDYAAAGFRQEMKSALILDGLQLNSGESREFSVTLQLKDDSLAGQELVARAELINNPLNTTAAFISNISYVDPRHSITARTGSDNLVAIPGQTITVPFVVTNNGNVREKFKIAYSAAEAPDATVFNDLNRDGIRQSGEPAIVEIGPLAPREEANILVEIKTPKGAGDGSKGTVQVSFASDADAACIASESIQLNYSRPVLKMVMAGHNERLKPGDVTSFDLLITNNGSNLARVVELQSDWPEQLELVAAEPAASTVNSGTVVWRFKELGAIEKRSIKVSFRVKPGIGVGTAIQVKSILTYEDQLGNRY